MRLLNCRVAAKQDLPCLVGTVYEREAIRRLREPLLEAFDIYKSNLFYGVVTESEEEHAAVLGWYRRLLDLDPASVTAVPPQVEKYVKQGGV